MMIPLLLALQAATTPPAPPPAPPPAKRIAPSKVILVGDSTMQVGSGWGGSFCALHVTSFLACVDLARGGRSSGSYRAEGSWDVALAEIKTRGYAHIWVLIQFGHNDQPGKPGRSTDLATEFPANLRRYVAEARAAGATPLLVTPLTRRTFKGAVLDNDLIPWAEAARRVAKETGAPLIDLNADSATAVQALGEAAADALAQVPQNYVAPPATATEANDMPLAAPNLAFDHTHLGRAGADYFSAMVTRELAATVPEMRPLLLR